MRRVWRFNRSVLAFSILIILGPATLAYSQLYEVVDLSDPPGATRASHASAVNNVGQVVGTMDGAVLWENGDMIDLDGGVYARGINNTGQVVGRSDAKPGDHAFLWDPVEGMMDLGILGGYEYAQAEAINDDGHVIGWSYVDRDKHAFIWSEAEGMTDLGTLGGSMSQAFAINNVGQVVGWAHTLDTKHAFLWDKHTGMVDLNTLMAPGSNFSSLEGASGINDLGHIVGYGYTIDGKSHAFLMIPEPITLSFIGFGGFVLLRTCRQP